MLIHVYFLTSNINFAMLPVDATNKQTDSTLSTLSRAGAILAYAIPWLRYQCDVTHLLKTSSRLLPTSSHLLSFTPYLLLPPLDLLPTSSHLLSFTSYLIPLPLVYSIPPPNSSRLLPTSSHLLPTPR